MRAAGVTDVDESLAGPFRYRPLGGRYLITNDFGDWCFLSATQFRAFVEGTLDKDDALYTELRDKRFIHGEIALEEAVALYRRRHGFLQHGPERHIVAVTTRTNQQADEGEDMGAETVERAVDCAFMTTSPRLTLVVAGGEPLLNRPGAHRAIEYAGEKNRLARKELRTVVETDLQAADEAEIAWMVKHDVRVRARLTDSLLHEDTSPARAAIRALHAAWAEVGYDPADHHVELVAELRADQLDSSEAVVDLAVALGCRTVDFAPQPGFGFVDPDAPEREYRADAWLRAYERAFARMLHHEREGHPIRERTAAALLARILDGKTEDECRLRSPASDGIGQFAYHVDGRVFASEGGRKLAERGEDIFQIGELRKNGYHDMVTSPTVRALVMATTLEGQPGWIQSAYKPFAGVSPARCYGEQGSIHGRMQDSEQARELHGILDLLFLQLSNEGVDPEVQAIFGRWAGTDPAGA
ncbi:MAG: hypothetical protein H6744_19120 [Deltaproteobacteria bacterium]|nr:hypothetical protein [Deltaproteobacteria bacterium]MCB9788795.1 hypothetical protein [Deltaproteobacteria bacterium]